MIDIHCHILPGVDDGAATLEHSIEMARKAVDEGITTIIATPHHNAHFQNSSSMIEKDIIDLNHAFEQEGINLKILPGQEPRINADLLKQLENQEVLTLCNQKKYVHIELPSNHIPKYTQSLLYEIQLQGLTPIIVHPERNIEIVENPDMLFELVNDGVLTQVTSSSLIGNFGKNIQKFSRQLIEHELTHFIASDAHNISSRAFHLRGAYEQVEKDFGIKARYQLQENPMLLVNGEKIMSNPPQPIKKKKFLGIF
ncbi:tyrosine-protein phosphatase [Alkalihalobacillus sp. TS-13]|uniref:tyrosine-protein phosphatase n=1 Tax=Alkalihalobacillus sp. TS-13 TaxID=2842455 RepID=UPI001C871191|nr:CpsB/CapC family capsule biosynthesis tyrosine phosphatase [Alkalihalobacillus sp. TS-13]